MPSTAEVALVTTGKEGNWLGVVSPTRSQGMGVVFFLPQLCQELLHLCQELLHLCLGPSATTLGIYSSLHTSSDMLPAASTCGCTAHGLDQLSLSVPTRASCCSLRLAAMTLQEAPVTFKDRCRPLLIYCRNRQLSLICSLLI